MEYNIPNNAILVMVESPYAGNVELNKKYLNDCFVDCLLRGESPIASHKLYPDIPLCYDDYPERRRLGIESGYAWGSKADKIVVYIDLGMSSGMKRAIDVYSEIGKLIEYRRLKEWSMDFSCPNCGFPPASNKLSLDVTYHACPNCGFKFASPVVVKHAVDESGDNPGEKKYDSIVE